MSKLMKQAQAGDEMMETRDDLSLTEMDELYQMIRAGKVFDAISAAFNAGYVRGRTAEQRGQKQAG